MNWNYAFQERDGAMVIRFESLHTQVIYSHESLSRICGLESKERCFIPVPCEVLKTALLEYNERNAAIAA